MSLNEKLVPVYLGARPLEDPGWLAYTLGRIEKKIFHDQRSKHTFCLIAWPDCPVRVELELKKVSEKSTIVLETEMPELIGTNISEHWEQLYPEQYLIYIGQTTTSREEVKELIKKYQEATPRYSAFWENCRSFCDSFLKEIITHDQVWKLAISHPEQVEDAEVVAPLTYKFDSPLEYLHWKRKKVMKKLKQVHAAEGIPLKKTKTFSAEVLKNGRVNMNFNDFDTSSSESESESESGSESATETELEEKTLVKLPKHQELTVPPLNVLIMIVGSRGDVQPFVAMGKALMAYGHRVRLATHETFRKFVKENGLEFYPLAGDPAELMAFMVKNPGLFPKMETMLAGEISRKRELIGQILKSCWDACVNSDEETGRSFTAEAIISNPPTFGHIHCAEKLLIPLQIFFTMPWSPTKSFPHPLVNMNYFGAPPGQLNYLSYSLFNNLTWHGLRDVINDFRHKTLGLRGISVRDGPAILHRLQVPHTYFWSPSLVPKPLDWADHIDVVGFSFLDLKQNYEPPQDLVDFLNAGKPPVYIGFGSIVVDDPDALTQTIFEAVKRAGVRAIVSKGWGGLGGGEVPENVYLIGNCPHDWLFHQVSAVCHHGGAGTTAAGLLAGRPTVIVPFFGDQPFWGAMVASMGVGPPPLGQDDLTAETLATSLQFALTDRVKINALELSKKIQAENGVEGGVLSFHRHLPLNSMTCDLLSKELAYWYSEEVDMKLSTKAASSLLKAKKIKKEKLFPYKWQVWETRDVPDDLLEGINVGANSVITSTINGFTGFISHSSDGVKKAFSGEDHSLKQAFVGVGKGLGVMIYYPVKGTGRLMEELAQGLHNTNALVDKKEHKKRIPKVNNALDGVSKGSAALAKGIGEGVMDFFVKPVKGAEQQGKKGFLKGFAKGTVSLATKPLAGTLDFIVLNAKGSYKSVKKLASSSSESDSKQEEGEEEEVVVCELNEEEVAGELEAGEKEEILERFEQQLKWKGGQTAQ